MKRIERLTPAQEIRLIEFREEMRAIGLRTGHDSECEKIGRQAILDAYRELDREPPKLIIWAQSPLQAVLMGYIFENGLPKITKGQLRGQLRGQLWGQLGGKLWGQLGRELGDQLGDQLGGQLGGQLRDQLRVQLGDQLGRELGGQLGGQLQKIYGNWWNFGQCESYWIAWAMFGAEIGVKLDEKLTRRLDLVARLAKAAYMCFSWEGLTILVHHPEKISFDARKLLHSEDGPALRWSDGYGVTCWHGTRVPDEWLSDRANLDPKIALTDPSVERRRAAAEIIGWTRIMEAVPHRLIDRDPDPEIGELLSVDLPDAPGSHFLKVRCGTGRTFVLPVPNECMTALEANAWTYDINPLDLKKLEART